MGPWGRARRSGAVRVLREGINVAGGFCVPVGGRLGAFLTLTLRLFVPDSDSLVLAELLGEPRAGSAAGRRRGSAAARWARSSAASPYSTRRFLHGTGSLLIRVGGAPGAPMYGGNSCSRAVYPRTRQHATRRPGGRGGGGGRRPGAAGECRQETRNCIGGPPAGLQVGRLPKASLPSVRLSESSLSRQ